MTSTDRKIQLYRTLITIGLVLAALSVAASLAVGTFIPMALWLPVGYAVLAWVIYSVIVSIWGRQDSAGQQ